VPKDLDLTGYLFDRWAQSVSADHEPPPNGIETITQRVGFGKRTLFVCPKCTRPRRTLYMSGIWRCRVCGGLRYETSFARGGSTDRRVAAAANRLARHRIAHPNAETRNTRQGQRIDYSLAAAFRDYELSVEWLDSIAADLDRFSKHLPCLQD
jgi:ribosomal protein L37AE/L43A